MTETYTTTKGIEIEFIPIAFLIEKARAATPMPAIPTYEVETVGGGIEVHTHNETTLESDEDREVWQQYQQDRMDAHAEINETLLRVTLLKGIRVEIPPDEEWIPEHEACGLSVPEDPFEKRLHYIQTEVIGSSEEIGIIMAGASRASFMSTERLEQMEATFRGEVGQRDGEDAGGDSGDIGEESSEPA